MGALIKVNGETTWSYSAAEPKNPNNSNNVAEYKAFIELLKSLKNLGYQDRQVIVNGDSMLVVQQMNGNWRIKEGRYRPYALEALKLVGEFTNLIIRHVYREKNQEADDLSKQSLEKFR